MGITIPLKVSLDKKLCEAGCFSNLKKKEQKGTNKMLGITWESVCI